MDLARICRLSRGIMCLAYALQILSLGLHHSTPNHLADSTNLRGSPVTMVYNKHNMILFIFNDFTFTSGTRFYN